MDCIFCKITQGEMPSKVLFEDELVMVIMDANPNVDGHALIIPKKHYTDYLDLDEEIMAHIFAVAKKMGPKIMDKLNAQALTLVVNYGNSQVVKHFHMHILPNYHGSNNLATKTVGEIYDILKD